jgi:mitochondrial fission protein ELM1
VVSSGGRTLLANIALARLYGAPNVFAGTLRGLPPEAFSAVVQPYAEAAGKPRHVVALKPSPVDPDAMRAPAPWPEGRRAALLVGGPSGAHGFSDADWAGLAALVSAPGRIVWRVVTSPRTPGAEADRLIAAAGPSVDGFVDFRSAGPGSIAGALDWADAVVCTEDSSSMITEAVYARRPVLALLPAERRLRPDEAGMLDALTARGLVARRAMAGIDAAEADRALGEARPLAANPLDDLARALAPMLGWAALPAAGGSV